MSRHHASGGFTLVEVLVALMVVAMGLAALMVAVSGTARTSGYLRDKTLAQWMALNRLSEVRLNLNKFGQNTDTGELNFANRTWHYDTRYFDTSIPTMKRVVVRVYAGDAKTKGNPLAEVDRFSRQRSRRARQFQRRLDRRQHRRYGGRRARRHSRHHAWHHARHTAERRDPGDGHPDASHGACTHRADAGPHPAVQPVNAMRRKQQGESGFTLIEVLVALLILGIMSALGYGTYRAARISAERTEESLQRSREIEFGMRMMMQDFAEMAPRPVRDILGQQRLPALRGTGGVGTLSAVTGAGASSGSSSAMSFASQSFAGQSFNSDSSSTLGGNTSASAASIVDMTRAGWSNTAGQQRGTLQRVSYALVNDVLKRSYQVNLDTVQGNQPVVQDLFTGIKAIQLRYLDGNQTWQSQWPPPTLPPSEASGHGRWPWKSSLNSRIGVEFAGSSRWPDERRCAPTMRGRPLNPARQRGVALIIALILVALATILATKLTFDGFLERRRAIGVLAAEQAVHFGYGAEALAADVLTKDAQNSPQLTTLAAAWAQPTQPLPITPQDDPEGEPIGTLQGEIEDMQGRFNLNNLAHVDPSSAPAGSAAAAPGAQGPMQDPQPLEQFQRLLVSVGLEPKWAAIARDWIDADDIPGPDGAEDQVYTSQTPPYRTGNWPMMSPSELMNMPGFGADRYRKIAPYVTALPTATGGDQHLHRTRRWCSKAWPTI